MFGFSGVDEQALVRDIVVAVDIELPLITGYRRYSCRDEAQDLTKGTTLEFV